MVKRSPRFHHRPKDPGVDDGLVASAMTTLAFDAKEIHEKTQQRKSYEILPPEPQQWQQWCLPNRANGSSSNSNNNQYSNKDGGGDDGEEMVVFFYGEDSGNERGTIAPTNNTTSTDGSKTDFLDSILAHSDNDNDYNNYNDSDDSFYVPNSTPNMTYNEISDDDSNSGILGSSSSSMDIAQELLCEDDDSEEENSSSNSDSDGNSEFESCDSDDSSYDSDDSSYDSDGSSYDGADLTDFGVGSGLIMEYIDTKLRSEPDYELFANNGASIGFAEVFGKFMDQYETKFDHDGKLMEGFKLFDQDSIPYEQLLQGIRSSHCMDLGNDIRSPNYPPEEVPRKKSYKAKVAAVQPARVQDLKPATTATMKVSEPKAPRWTRPRKTPHKKGKALATAPKVTRKKKQVFTKARMKRMILARSKVVIDRIRRGRAPKFKSSPVGSAGIMMTSETKQVSEPKSSSNGSKWMEAILQYIMFLSSTSETTHHCVA
jgi:hypothetical protein